MSNLIDNYFSFLGVYHNELVNSCITNCVYTILQIEKIKNPLLYFECSLCFNFKKADNAILGYHYSCSREILSIDYKERVIEHHNLDFYDYNHYSYDELWEIHRTNLINKNPIILLCDLFYLSYYKDIRKEHRLHGIIAYSIDENEDKLYIIDNGKQFYNGPISIEEFKRAWCSEYFSDMFDPDAEIPSNKVWYKVKTDNWKNKSFYKLLSSNLISTLNYYYRSDNNSDTIYGLEGIEKILHNFQQCYIQKKDIKIALKELKDILFEVISRMKLNKLFLTFMKEEIKEASLDDFIERIDNDILLWNALYNLVLKGHVIFNDSLYEKIVKKAKKCIEIEWNREAITLLVADVIEMS